MELNFRVGPIPIYDAMKIYDKLYILTTCVPNHIVVDIDDWDIDTALILIKSLRINNAYAFRFQRRMLDEERTPGAYNIKVKTIKDSGTYYLGGYLETEGCTTIIRSVKNGDWSCVFNDGIDTIIEEEK
jgi:hypothetical protein